MMWRGPQKTDEVGRLFTELFGRHVASDGDIFYMAPGTTPRDCRTLYWTLAHPRQFHTARF
eukprot:3501242-Amphidinium_carterae.1